MNHQQEIEADAATRIYQVISMIPYAHVATYGQVAALAGLPGRARLVGQVLASLPTGSTLPWFRVIAASGHITHPAPQHQADRLRAEGLTVSGRKVSLRRYRWTTAAG